MSIWFVGILNNHFCIHLFGFTVITINRKRLSLLFFSLNSQSDVMWLVWSRKQSIDYIKQSISTCALSSLLLSTLD